MHDHADLIAREITAFSARVVTMLGELRTRTSAARQARYQARQAEAERNIDRAATLFDEYSEHHVLDSAAAWVMEAALTLEHFSRGSFAFR